MRSFHKKTSFFLILVIFLFLFSVSSYSISEYKQTGIDEESTYVGGNTNFNADVTTTTSARSLSSDLHFSIPKSADLDGDGDIEIVVMDGDGSNIELYEAESLNVIDSTTQGSTVLGDFQIADLDGDGTPNIYLFVKESTSLNRVISITWNGSAFNETQVVSGFPHVTSSPLFFPNAIMKCNTDMCGVVYKDERNCTTPGGFEDSAAITLRAYLFNQTNISGNTYATIDSNADCTGDGAYFPLNPHLSSADINSDGIEDYVFTYLRAGFGETSESHLVIYQQGGNGFNITVRADTTMDSYGADYAETIFTLPFEKRSWATAPMIKNIDGGSNSEIVVGVAVDLDPATNNIHDFKIHTFDSSGTFIDDHPESTNIEGIFMSNPFSASCMDEDVTNGGDYGVMVYAYEDDTGTEEELVICGSQENTRGIYQTTTFNVPARSFNITPNDIFGTIHSTQAIAGGVNEFISPYGMYRYDYSSCGITNICDVVLIWEAPNSNSVIIPMDVQLEGYDDMVALTENNIFFYDDGFVNTNAEIDGYSINPCAGLSVVKQNESIRVSITPTDVDGDTVQAKAILYYGETNEQDSNWSALVPSGATITLPDLIANETTIDSILRLSPRDSEHDSAGDSIDILFSVGINGVEFGDCTNTVEGLVEVSAAENATGLEGNVNNNSITNALRDITGYSGLSGLLVWLAFMAFVALVIWINGDNTASDGAKFGVIAIVEIILLIGGTVLTIVPFGITLSIIVIGIVVIGMMAAKFFRQGAAGGG